MCWLDHWASYHCMEKCNLGKGGVDALWEHRGGLIRFLEDVMGWEEDGPCIVSAYLSRSSFSVSSFGYLLRNPKSQTVNNTVGEEAERISYEDHQETKTRFAFPTSSFPLPPSLNPQGSAEVMGSGHSGKGRTSRRWARSGLFWVTALFLLVSLLALFWRSELYLWCWGHITPHKGRWMKDHTHRHESLSINGEAPTHVMCQFSPVINTQ